MMKSAVREMAQRQNSSSAPSTVMLRICEGRRKDMGGSDRVLGIMAIAYEGFLSYTLYSHSTEYAVVSAMSPDSTSRDSTPGPSGAQASMLVAHSKRNDSTP